MPNEQPAPNEQNAKGGHFLSHEDVTALLNDTLPESRAAVAAKVAAGYSTGQFRESELLIAEQIFRLLLRDTEVQVRAALAEGLKHNDHAPRDIIVRLAGDNAEMVATPVLLNSNVFTEEDLIDIIRSHTDITKHIAIANRKNVSSMVSAAIVETQQESVVEHLVKNQGATISEHSMQKIIDDHGTSKTMANYMAERGNLPLDIVERLLSIVSESVASGLKKKYHEVAERLEREANHARENMTLRLLDTTRDDESVLQLVRQLSDAGRLTPSITLTALCRGNFAFFETSLAHMASIPVQNAQKLVRDKGELGFKSLYRKAGLPDSMFEACRLVLAVMHEIHEQNEEVVPGTIHFANRAVEKILSHQNGGEVENLAYILALVRQNVR